MATQKRTIGKLPVFRGDWLEGVVYSKFNIVTYLGSSFISTMDDNGNVPCTVENNAFVLSYGWNYMANASDSYLLKQREEDIPQGVFDAMQEAGMLDTTKNYYTYEEE